MARNEALEAWLDQELGAAWDTTQKAMFGGRAWLIDGHLTCAARHDGMLARVGPEGEAKAPKAAKTPNAAKAKPRRSARR